MAFRADLQVLRDDSPLDFCDWSLNSNAALPAGLEITSFSQLDDSIVDELVEKKRNLTDEKLGLLKLNLADSMKIAAEKRLPLLLEKRDSLVVEIEKIENEIEFNGAGLPADCLEKLKKKLAKKQKSLDWLENRLIPSNDNLPLRASSCNSQFDFGVFFSESLQSQYLKAVRGRTCKNRLCPACNARRAFGICVKTLAQVVSMAENGVATCGVKGKKKKVKFKKGVAASFLTLTVENPKLDDVKATFKKMKTALSVLFSDSQKYKKGALRNDWIRKNVKGALCCLEWFGDNTKDGEAHLHFHILLIHDGALPYSKNKNYVEKIFRRAWAKALGRENDWFSVEWHAMRSFEESMALAVERGTIFKEEKFQNLKDEKLKGLFAMVLEVSKYAVTQATLNKMSSESVAKLYLQSEFCRQVEKFGVFYGFEFENEESVDSILERVFSDFVDTEKGDWVKKALVRYWWNVYKQKYYADLLDVNGDFIESIPSLNELDLLDTG